ASDIVYFVSLPFHLQLHKIKSRFKRNATRLRTLPRKIQSFSKTIAAYCRKGLGKRGSAPPPPDTSPPPRSFAETNPSLHICDLYDSAPRLRVLWILHHSHVQFFLAFARS